MNKAEFIREIAFKADLSLKDAQKAFDSMVEVVASTLKKGDKIILAGFGTFELRQKQERLGVNPRTGERVLIEAQNTPVLRFGDMFKDYFN